MEILRGKLGLTQDELDELPEKAFTAIDGLWFVGPLSETIARLRQAAWDAVVPFGGRAVRAGVGPGGGEIAGRELIW